MCLLAIERIVIAVTPATKMTIAKNIQLTFNLVLSAVVFCSNKLMILMVTWRAKDVSLLRPIWWRVVKMDVKMPNKM